MRGEEDPFEGMGDQSFRTRSSVTAPIFKTDPFNIKNAVDAAAVAANNEVAVIDDENAPPLNSEIPAQRNSDENHIPPPPPPPSTIFAEDEVDDWSDVSI